MKTALVWVVVLAVVGFGVGWFTLHSQNATNGDDDGAIARVAVPVRVTSASPGDFTISISYTGDVRGVEEVTVYPSVSGKIVEKYVNEGDRVRAGDALAAIDRDITGMTFETAVVRSRVDGIIEAFYPDIGDNVSPPSPSPQMGTPIAKIVNFDSVKVVFPIPEVDLGRVRAGQRVQVSFDAFAGSSWSARMYRISPTVDRASRTAVGEIRLPNSDLRIRPGMFARVTVVTKELEDVIVLPRDAVLKDLERQHVYVAERDTARRRFVEVAAVQGDSAAVLRGVRPGDLVITTGQQLVTSGTPVDVVSGNAAGGER